MARVGGDAGDKAMVYGDAAGGDDASPAQKTRVVEDSALLLGNVHRLVGRHDIDPGRSALSLQRTPLQSIRSQHWAFGGQIMYSKK